MDHTPQQPNTEDMITPQQLIAQIAIAFLITTGVTLLAFSLAYIQDLETLRSVPGAVWDAICGRPTDNGLTLPLLLTSSTLSFLIAGGLFIWNRWFQPQEM
jgi:hypothetical protein